MAWRWTVIPASAVGLFTDCPGSRLCPHAKPYSGGVEPGSPDVRGAPFLLVGLMTPLVAVLVAAGGIGIALSWIPLPGQDVFDSYLAITNLIILPITIALLGPGAFSLDARMFGRREITIPRS